MEKIESRRYIITALAVVFIVALVFIVKNGIDRHTYSSYEVVSNPEKSDSVSGFEYVGGRIFRYSPDGASLLKKDFTVLWNESFSMTKPKSVVCQDQILLYDQEGTLCNIYSGDQKVGAFDTPLPILKADISGNGTICVIMMDGTKSKFAYYKSDGTQIATGEATIKDPGYPTDVAVSPNGEKVVISYLSVTDGTVGSTVEFYYFSGNGTTDQNLIETESYDVLIPEVYYPDNSRCVLVREDGLSVYKGGKSVELSETVDFDDEIVSTFHDEEHIVFLFRTASGSYRMEIYTTKGRRISSEVVDLNYENARVSDDQILFYRNNKFAIYSMNGFCRFEGELNEGNLSDIIKIGRNRYLVSSDEIMEIVKLK